NRAILQIANLQLVWVFTGVGLLCLLHPAALADTPLGRAVLAGMSAFWIIRIVAQLLWLRVNHPLVHVLTALFACGALLFAWPLLAGCRAGRRLSSGRLLPFDRPQGADRVRMAASPLGAAAAMR